MTKVFVGIPPDGGNRGSGSWRWTPDETLRRAAEQLLARHPVVESRSTAWSPPVSDAVGWRGLNPAALHAAALDDLEERSTGAAHDRTAAGQTADNGVT